jgi:DNA-binding MurR/RpiR family transcriptional regulator
MYDVPVGAIVKHERNGAALDLARFDKLSPKHQKVARFMAENPAFATFATAAELGERAGVSAATVVRFAQALGFNGYSELQQNARHGYLRTLRPLEAFETRTANRRDAFEAELYQDIENLRRTVHSLHYDQLADVARRIRVARQTVIIASGSYSAIALVLGHHLQFMGYRATVEDRGVTFWKGIREIVKAVGWAHSRGIPTIAITDTVYSPIAKSADVTIALPTEGVSFFQSMVAPMSVVHGLVAQLALDADPAHKQVMKEAEESYELLEIMNPG